METNQTPAPRVHLHMSVEFRKNYARESTRGHLRNVSLTGAFLETVTGDLQASDKIKLILTVSGRERQLNARVIWTSARGAGIRFLPFNNQDVQIVDDLIYFVENSRSSRLSVLDTIFKKASSD